MKLNKNEKFVMIYEWNSRPATVVINRNTGRHEYVMNDADKERLNDVIRLRKVSVDIAGFTTIGFRYPF